MATAKISASSSRDSVAPEEELAEGSMTFWEHLQELRTRLVRMVLAFVLGAVIAWWFKEDILVLLTKPYIDGWADADKAPTLHFSDPAGLFISYVKIAVLGGAILSLPIQLYQLWAFIAPGLYAREKWIAIPFVVVSTLLFCLGAYFGWRFVFPIAFQYLLSFAALPLNSTLTVTPTVMIESYLSFIMQALLAFGLVFEIPVVVFFLSFIGVINHTHLIKFYRYFIVIAFIVAAVVTPPDPMSQIMLAVPLVGLYTFSIGIAWLVHRMRTKPTA